MAPYVALYACLFMELCVPFYPHVTSSVLLTGCLQLVVNPPQIVQTALQAVEWNQKNLLNLLSCFWGVIHCYTLSSI